MTAPSDPRIPELIDAITATRPGTVTTWVSAGVTVTVYGQRRYELEVPTPWAQITVNGRVVVVRTWEQLLDLVDAASHHPQDQAAPGDPHTERPDGTSAGSAACQSPKQS